MQTENTQANQASDFQQAAPILAPSARQQASNPNTLTSPPRSLTVVGPPAQPSTSSTPPNDVFWPFFVLGLLALMMMVISFVALRQALRPAYTPVPEPMPQVVEAKTKKKKKTKPNKRNR